MIERHVTFHLLPNQGQAFTRFFSEEYRPSLAKTKGFLCAELLHNVDKELDYTMILRFQSLDAAASWRACSDHQALKPKLKSFYGGSDLIVFEVIVASES